MNIKIISIAEKIQSVIDRVRAAEKLCGGNEGEVTVVGITKTFGSDVIREAVKAGITDIGENRVQEAEWKFAESGSGFKKHLVGHLQTNKVNKALELFDVIHSVDSVKLATKLAAAGKVDKKYFLEVNTTGEGTKFGVEPDAAIEILNEISESTGLSITGLMTIGPYTNEKSEIRKAFKRLKLLFDKASSIGIKGMEMKELSMGMTDDFEIAIEEGATLIRVGRALFGERT